MDISSHTTLKHRMLGFYFLICRQIAKNRILHYVDLYAGDGEATCEEAPLPQYKCPFIKGLLEHAKNGKIKLKVYLNEFDPDDKGYFTKLEENVKPYSSLISSLTKEDANIVYKQILNMIPKGEWTLCFLDPFKHSDLHWETVEAISKYEGYDKITRTIRKPELIINFMTLTIQRTLEAEPNKITEALGTDVWKEKIENKTD